MKVLASAAVGAAWLGVVFAFTPMPVTAAPDRTTIIALAVMNLLVMEHAPLLLCGVQYAKPKEIWRGFRARFTLIVLPSHSILFRYPHAPRRATAISLGP